MLEALILVQPSRFNPCSNGMKKEPITKKSSKTLQICFNPCSNGMKKELHFIGVWGRCGGFNPCSNGMKKERCYTFGNY